MSPAKKSAKQPAKKAAKKSVKKATKKAAKRPAKKAAKNPAKKSVRKSAKKSAKRPAKKATKSQTGKGAVGDSVSKGSGATQDERVDPVIVQRLRNLDQQDVLHALAQGLVRLGEGYDWARREVTAGAHWAKGAAVTGQKRIQEAGAEARTRLSERTHNSRETAVESIATARGVSVGVLMRMGDARDEFLVRLADGADDLSKKAREAREKGQDFYARHREEIIALTITAIKIAAVIGVRRLTAPREKKEGEAEGEHKVDVVAVVGNLLGQVGKLLAHQPSALPLLREVYRKGDPAEQAVVGLLLAPTLHQDPEHAMEVIEEFLEGASEEPAADTIARRTLAPLLKDHPELMETVVSWMRAAGPLVKRGALIALSNLLRDRRSKVGDVVAAAVIVLEDHDEEVREAVAWFMEAASEVDLEMTARTIADWARARGEDIEQVARRLPARLGERVRDLAQDGEPAGWDA